MIESRMIATRTELVAENGIVAGGHPLEAEAGTRLLEQGGNAVDAVVGAAFARSHACMVVHRRTR